MLYGIDVSEWQNQPAWALVVRSGIQFAIARTSYGLNHNDRDYQYNKARILENGILPGAYHFLVSGQDAAKQADTFCSIADPNAFHFVDVEAGHLDVASFVKRYREHYPSKTLGVYTGRDLWNHALSGILGGNIGPLWVAGYKPNRYVSGSGTVQDLYQKVGGNNGGTPFAGWERPLLMQHTATARVPGIVGNVDGDVFFGSAQDWRRLSADVHVESTPVGDEPVTDDEMNTIAFKVWNRFTLTDPSGKEIHLVDAIERLLKDAEG